VLVAAKVEIHAVFSDDPVLSKDRPRKRQYVNHVWVSHHQRKTVKIRWFSPFKTNTPLRRYANTPTTYMAA